jgi:hypothetical protein
MARIIVGALSGLLYEDRRLRCRRTWFLDARRAGLLPVFLLGAHGEVAQPCLLDDRLLLPCPDAYDTLPQRTRWFCRWALAQTEWEYLFKCDDDTYVAMDRLAAYDQAGRDYIGAEWSAGVNYGSGGAGYFLSRKAAEIVAERLTMETGPEDLLVGQVLHEAGISLSVEPRFVPFSHGGRRPRAHNDLITGHAFSAELFLESHAETGNH